MKRLGIVLALVGLVATGCADRTARSLGEVPGGGDASPSPASPAPAPSPAAGEPEPDDGGSPSPGRTFDYEVWLASPEGALFLVRRTAPFEPGVGRIAVNDLLSGPTTAERAAGVGTAVPGGTTLRGLRITDGVAVVDLTAEFARGSGSHAERLRLAQLVYTLTQFDTVRGVRLAIDGTLVGSFGSHGLAVDRPQTRRMYEDLLPAIVVESPAPGDRVSSPVSVSGTANVFEATVSLRILDAAGRVIARTFTTATCGSGCRGDYVASVRFDVDAEQPGVIEVFESSAEDGRAINVVSIPVTLLP